MSELSLIRSRLTVDIDQLDAALALELGPFCDMSESNTGTPSHLADCAKLAIKL